MSPLLDLIILSLAMGGGTFFFGLLPLGLRLSRLTLRILEVGGAGLLLGAAASVVMPEGAGALFRSQPGGGHKHDENDGHDHANRRRGIADVDPETLLAMGFLAGMLVLFIIDQLMAPGPHIHAPPSHNHDEPEPDREAGMHIDHAGSRHVDRPHLDRHLSRMSRPESMILTRSNAIPTLSSLGKKSKLSSTGSVNAGSSNSKNGKSRNDSPSSGSDGSVTGLPADYYTTTTQDHVESAYRKQNAHARQSSTPSSPLLGATRSPPSSPPRRRDRESRHDRDHEEHAHDHDEAASITSARGLRAAFTSIAGLLIHAACDGIAMGASAASHDEGLKLVVVGAILLHKAPAAFGLCTLLISRGMSRADIRKAMAIFSLATPAGALGTYLALNVLLGGGEGAISPAHIGTALTFSAGSFVYVALDAVHELASSSSDYERGPDGRHVARMTLGRSGRIATLLSGAILPKALQSVLGHGH